MPTNSVFTIDWEPWFAMYPYSKFWEENNPLVEEPTYYLLDLLRRHQIRAIWYCVGWLEQNFKSLVDCIRLNGHVIGYHSFYHKYDSCDIPDYMPYRSPRWKNEKRLYSGGFWLRAMPYWWLKREVLKERTFFIHPHDLLFEHPKLLNPWQDWHRHIGLKTSRDKLERLCREVEFETSLVESSVA